MIYFDSAGSYPILTEIKANIAKYFENDANPSASNTMAVSQMEMINSVREQIADEIGAMSSEIIFTSGATESNNLAIKAHFNDPLVSNRRHMIISSIEHKCVHAIAEHLIDHMNVSVSVVEPNSYGVITVDAIQALLRPDTSLVSVMHVNNELGSVNPLADIGKFCYDAGIKFHTDCAQSFMKREIDVDDQNIDYLSLSAHKIGGFKGIGAVYIRDRRDMSIVPVIHGAGQEDGLRGGTLPAPLIEAFGDAIELFPLYNVAVVESNFSRSIREELFARHIPFQANGDPSEFILSLTLPSTDVALMIRSTEDTFALASSSACNSGSIEPSHVLTAIGLDREAAEHTIRVSFHHNLDSHDILALVDAIEAFTSITSRN